MMPVLSDSRIIHRSSILSPCSSRINHKASRIPSSLTYRPQLHLQMHLLLYLPHVTLPLHPPPMLSTIISYPRPRILTYLVYQSPRQPYIPPLASIDLFRVQVMCRDHYAAISRAHEGLKSETFDFLCSRVAHLEPVSIQKDRSGLLAAAAAILLGTVV